jgi:hypothetical protein
MEGILMVNKPAAIFSILASIILACGCSTTRLPPTSAFKDDWPGLFHSVSLNIGDVSRTYYLGSDDNWSYFETTEEYSMPTYRKVETSSMVLPRTFPFGQEKPYQIQLNDFVGHNQKRGLP